jgi:sugar lactone lactonase YvrE
MARLTALVAPIVAGLIACAQTDPPEPAADPPVDTDPSDTDPDTDPPVDTDPPDTDPPVDTDPPTTLYPPVTVDCAAPPLAPPLRSRALPGVETTEDIAFDTTGLLIGSAFSGPVVAFARDGSARVVAAPGETRGVDLLPDGRLLVSNPDDGTLVAIDLTTGALELRATLEVGVSGLDIDADGVVYVGNLSFLPGAFRAVAPDGSSERFTELTADSQSYGAGLSPDEQRLYLSRYNAGELWISDRGPDGRFGPATPWATADVLGFSGVVTDACGRVYTMDAFRCELWRFDPATAVGAPIFRGPRGAYCPNLAFGRGLGGFSATAVYVSTYAEVIEVEVGAAGRPR